MNKHSISLEDTFKTETEIETTTELRTSTTTHSETLEEHTTMKPTEGSGVNTGEEEHLLFESERENNSEVEDSEFINVHQYEIMRST